MSIVNKQQKLKECIRLIEQITGKKIVLKENDSKLVGKCIITVKEQINNLFENLNCKLYEEIELNKKIYIATVNINELVNILKRMNKSIDSSLSKKIYANDEIVLYKSEKIFSKISISFENLKKILEKEQIIINDKKLNELFGFSKNERDAKQAKIIKLEQIKVARMEIQNFNPERLIGQAGSKAKGLKPEYEDIIGVIKPKLRDAGIEMPNFKKLFPQLFEITPNSTNASTINYKDWENTYLPNKFFFSVENHQVSKKLFDQKANKMLNELEIELNKK